MEKIRINKNARRFLEERPVLTTHPEEDHRPIPRIRIVIPVRVQLRLVVPDTEVRTVLTVRGVNGSSCCPAPSWCTECLAKSDSS